MKQSILASAIGSLRGFVISAPGEPLAAGVQWVHIMASGVTTAPGQLSWSLPGAGPGHGDAEDEAVHDHDLPVTILTPLVHMVSGPCRHHIVQVHPGFKVTDTEAGVFWLWIQVLSLLASFASLLLTFLSPSARSPAWPRRLPLPFPDMAQARVH